jgi:hypothetical protein
MSRCHCNNSTCFHVSFNVIFAGNGLNPRGRHENIQTNIAGPELVRSIIPADESCPSCFEQRCQHCHARRHPCQIPIANMSPEEAFLGRFPVVTSSPALCNYQKNQASGHTCHDHSFQLHSAGQGQQTASDRQGQEHPNTGGWEPLPPRPLGYVADHSCQCHHTHDTRAINFERETDLVLHMETSRGPDVPRVPACQHGYNHPGRSSRVVITLEPTSWKIWMH